MSDCAEDVHKEAALYTNEKSGSCIGSCIGSFKSQYGVLFFLFFLLSISYQ